MKSPIFPSVFLIKPGIAVADEYSRIFSLSVNVSPLAIGGRVSNMSNKNSEVRLYSLSLSLFTFII